MRKSSILALFTEANNHIKSCRGLRTKFSENIEKNPNQSEKVVKVAVIGTPNAGKSAFINNLLKRRICPTSTKAGTTRSVARAIGVRKNSQIILLDTPGLVTEQDIKKQKLSNELMSYYRHSIQKSDLIAIIHDVSDISARSELHSTVLTTLKEYAHLPSFLVLNKIDTMKMKRDLFEPTRALTQYTLLPRGISRTKNYWIHEKNDGVAKKITGWPGFSDVFTVSSETGYGMTDVMEFILRHGKNSQWIYDKGEYTDQPPEELIVQSVRAGLLNYFPQEIPSSCGKNFSSCQFQIEYYRDERGKRSSNDRGRIFASVNVICPTERIEQFVCGKENEKLNKITKMSTSDLTETFQKPISLTISVKTNKKSD